MSGKDELLELLRWLSRYMDRPIDPTVIEDAKEGNLSPRQLLALGRQMGISAVIDKIGRMIAQEDNTEEIRLDS